MDETALQNAIEAFGSEDWSGLAAAMASYTNGGAAEYAEVHRRLHQLSNTLGVEPHFWLDPAITEEVVCAERVVLAAVLLDVATAHADSGQESDEVDAAHGFIFAILNDDRDILAAVTSATRSTPAQLCASMGTWVGLEVVGEDPSDPKILARIDQAMRRGNRRLTLAYGRWLGASGSGREDVLAEYLRAEPSSFQRNQARNIMQP